MGADLGRLRPALSIGLTLLAAAFLTFSLRAHWDTIRLAEIDLGWRSAATVALFVTAVCLSGLLWGGLVNELADRRTPASEAVGVHVQSWLLKYVPGQLGSVAAKLLWGSSKGVPAPTVLASFAYENIFHLLASFSLSLPVLLLLVPETRSSYRGFLVLLLVVQLAVVLSSGAARRFLPARFQGATKLLLAPRRAVAYEAGYLLPRLVNASGFVLLAADLGIGLTGREMIVVGSSYVLAGIIGILAFLVPSGLGVREAVIVLVLSSTLGEGDALLLAGLARALATLADGILLVGYLWWRRRVTALPEGVVSR